MRELAGLGESIVQQASRQRLALWTVDDGIAQGLPKTLGDATNNLPFDQPWVDDAATVVDPNVAQDGDLPRLSTHLYNHSMRAKGEGCPRQGVRAAENQPALCFHRPVRPAGGGSHKLSESQLRLRLVMIERATVLETDVFSRTG